MSHPARLILKLLIIIFVASATVMLLTAQPAISSADLYSVNVNGYLSVAAGEGLLANDTGFNTATHRLESFDATSQYGGAVAVTPDGAFTYDPPAGFVGQDSFTYTLRTATSASAAVVSINVTGDTVWFVNASAPASGDGTINAPFNDFTRVNGANGITDVDSVGETIFVYQGTYDVALYLEAGQKLIGHGVGLDLIGTSNDIPASTAPILNNTSSIPTASTIDLRGDGSGVHGFTINGTNNNAISAQNPANFSLSNLDINLTTNGALQLNGSSGTSNINNVNITGVASSLQAAIVIVNNIGTVNFTGSSVSGFTGSRILNFVSNGGTISFDSTSNITSTDTAGILISTQLASGVVTLPAMNLASSTTNNSVVDLLNNHASSTVNFEGELIVHTTGANSDALKSTGGKLKITGTTNALTADHGKAIELSSVELTQNATFDSLTSSDSTTTGISILNAVGNHDMIVGTTTITNPNEHAIRITSASASNFAFQTTTLSSTGGTVGIRVVNSAIGVTSNTSTISVSTGIAIDCSSATLSLSLATLTADGGTRGVNFVNCGGNVTAAAGSLNSTGGATNHVVNITTSQLQFTYGGTINKITAGNAINIQALAAPGLVTFNGAVTASNASNGVNIDNAAGPVTFSNLTLGATSARFSAKSITLLNNTGEVDLGVFSSYSAAVPALETLYTISSPGKISTNTGSILDTTGAAAALIVNSTNSQALEFNFNNIRSPGAGSHGINLNNTTGSIEVTGETTIGAKTIAGIQISNSNIDAKFKEVDITNAFDGVRLQNTSGNFTILGDEDFALSGTDGAGGTFTNIGDNAFDLNTVANLQVTDITINTTGSHAVTGVGLSGTTIFSNVDMSSIGTADNHNVYNFNQGATSGSQVRGTLDINHGTVTNFAETGLYLNNYADSLILKVINNTWENNITRAVCLVTTPPNPPAYDNCDGHGLLIMAQGNASITALVQGNNFNRIDGTGIMVTGHGAATPTVNITIKDNTLTANPYVTASHTDNGEIAMSLRNTVGNAVMRFNIDNNHIYNYSGEFAQGIIEVEGGGNTNTQGTIANNHIHHAHFGIPIAINSDGGDPLGFSSATASTLVVAVNNNTVSGPLYGSALFVLGSGSSTGSTTEANITVSNNNFSVSPTAAYTRTLSIVFDSYNRGCFNISGNTIAAGTGGSESIDFYYIDNSTVWLQGMSGSGDSNAMSRLNSTNTLAAGSYVGDNNDIAAKMCSTPNLPVLVP